MTRFLRFNLFAAIVLASIWTATASSAKAQGTPAKSAERDSVSVQDIERAAEQLAEAVQAAVRKATEDPAVKVAALKVAKNAVSAAQITITQQANTLEKVLDALAREIALATEKQQDKAKTP
ncbi:MAG: hypothetical protein ACR2GK_02130 [Gemmatimonadaceae bacterium]